MGDGVLACFSGALNAVYCGNSIINKTKDDPNHQVRVAIHIGEVVFANGDVFGDGGKYCRSDRDRSPGRADLCFRGLWLKT